MPLTGTIGQEAHFYDSYLLKSEPLPNSTAKKGREQTLNNTLGSLLIRGMLESDLTIPTDKSLSVDLEYVDADSSWVKEKTLFSGSAGTVAAGDLFAEVIVPDKEKRVFRLSVTSDFDASAVTMSCPIELLPR